MAEVEIVGVSGAGFVGHAGQVVFFDPVAAACPSGVHEEGVDVNFAGFVFGEAERVFCWYFLESGQLGGLVGFGAVSEEEVEVSEGKVCLFGFGLCCAVGCGVAEDADVVDAFVKVLAEEVLELRAVEVGGEVVLIGWDEVFVLGVDPFEGEFECPATGDNGSCGVDCAEFFGCLCCLDEVSVLR